MNYKIDRDDIGVYCESCRQPIYINERVIEIVLAENWWDGNNTVGQPVHFECISTKRTDEGDKDE